MTTYSKLFVCIAVFLGAAAFAVASPTMSQPSTAEFDIVVEKTDDGFALTCNEGCAWKTLSWARHDEVRVNYFGMTEAEEADRFLFTLAGIDEGFEL